MATLPLLLASAAAGDDARFGLGRDIFLHRVEPRCPICHSLADAGATGKVGPDLDQLQPTYEVVLRALENGIGPMRPYDGLTAAERDALAHYVSTITGG